MKYKKCPQCGLNYILLNEDICKVCKDESEGKKSIFDRDQFNDFICPYCGKNQMDIDDVMCKQCRNKRFKNEDTDV